MLFCLSPGAAKHNSSINMKDSIIFLLNAKDSVDAELDLISILVSIQDCYIADIGQLSSQPKGLYKALQSYHLF